MKKRIYPVLFTQTAGAVLVEVPDLEILTEGTETIVSLVDVDFEEYRRKNDNKMVRRNVTIPNWMDREAAREKINVSGVLREALAERLQANR